MKYQQQDVPHFSHHHVLIALTLDQVREEEEEVMNCNGCERPIREPFHGCLSCNFWLHDDCLNAPRFLKHPSHPHSLTLLPTPTYTCRSYSCNACGGSGGTTAFSLCCAECEFDLHVYCANLPAEITLREHPDHDLKLRFGSPYEDKNTKYGCDLCCGEMLPTQWLYYCSDCDFAADLDCGTDQMLSDGHDDAREKEEEVKASHETDTPSRPRSNNNNRGGKSNNKKKEVLSQETRDEESLYEAQRKMRETAIAHKLMLQALDNAADYVGPSRKYYYY